MVRMLPRRPGTVFRRLGHQRIGQLKNTESRLGMNRNGPYLTLLSWIVFSLAMGLLHAVDPEYERCAALLDARGVRDACGHAMNPSAVAFLPSSRRLVIGGHEYLIHATEGPEGDFSIDGCYYGEDRTLGRGDIEGVASLDFALTKPTPASDPTGRLATNWAKLKALEGHVFAAEENYSFRGIYLVDTARLRTGLIRSTEATVAKFEIPQYLRNLEALAFVPDLTDDDYLGVVIMGSQSRRIKACRVPLGNPSKPVLCERETGYYSGGSVDSMEYDPTFEVMPGVYGALIIGTDPADHAIYVDPWALALRGEVVRWTDEFEMRDGRVGGVPMVGREGHAIHGDKVFYAVDENSRARGAVICHMRNKPRSTATRVNGWHPSDAGDPTATLIDSSTKLIANFDFDRPAMVSTTQPLPSIGEVTSDYVMARWPAYALNGDGECGAVCREEKDVMCMLYPELCAHLRCQEFRSGRYSLHMGRACEGEDPLTGEQFGSPEAILQLGLTEGAMIAYWQQQSDTVTGHCDKACRDSKDRVCPIFPELCKELRCEDVRKGQDGGDQYSADSCAGVAKPAAPAELLPIPLVSSQMDRRWHDHANGMPDASGVCDWECRKDKWQMCVGNPQECWKLRCSDIQSGLLFPVLDCSGDPPSLIVEDQSSNSRRSIAAEDGVCRWGDCGGDSIKTTITWCQISLGNCVVGCRATWCPNSSDYQPVYPVKSSRVFEEPSSSSVTETDERNPVAAALEAIRAEAAARDNGTQSTQPTSAPTTNPTSPLLDSVTPTTPMAGYCNWNNCNGEAQGPDWCRRNADNCVYTCGGSWCWRVIGDMASSNDTNAAQQHAPPASPKPLNGVKFNGAFNDLPGKGLTSQVDESNSGPRVEFSPVDEWADDDARLRAEAAPSRGANTDNEKSDTGGAAGMGPLNFDVDVLASELGLDNDRLAVLVHVLAGIEDATRELELKGSKEVEPKGKK